MVRIANLHGCGSCADVLRAGRAFRESDARSLLQLATCAASEGEVELARQTLDDVIARRVTSTGLGGSIDQPYEWVLAFYHRGQLAEKAGDVALARSSYQTFVDRWGKADRVVPEVTDARKALARLAR